jgi:hypothetical protein
VRGKVRRMFCVLKIEVMGWWGLRVWGLEDGMGRDGGEGMYVRAREGYCRWAN